MVSGFFLEGLGCKTSTACCWVGGHTTHRWLHLKEIGFRIGLQIGFRIGNRRG
jgi:hypothetical protein